MGVASEKSQGEHKNIHIFCEYMGVASMLAYGLV